MTTSLDYQSKASSPIEAVQLPTTGAIARVYRAFIISKNVHLWYCDGGDLWGAEAYPTKGGAMARLVRLQKMERKYTNLTGLQNAILRGPK